jgi:hypothetical protein
MDRDLLRPNYTAHRWTVQHGKFSSPVSEIAVVVFATGGGYNQLECQPNGWINVSVEIFSTPDCDEERGSPINWKEELAL